MPKILEDKRVKACVQKAANTFLRSGLDYEDLLQVGYIGVWELCEKEEVMVANVEQYLGLIYTVAWRKMRDELRKTRAKSRIPAGAQVSIDTPLHDEGRALSDVLPSCESTPLDILLEKEGIDWCAALVLAKNRSFEERTRESKELVVRVLVALENIRDEDIPKAINRETFYRNGLGGWIVVFFNASPFRAINLAYPGKFLPYQMAMVPRHYWSGRYGKTRAVKALQWALKTTGHPLEEYPRLMTRRFFEEFKLTQPLVTQFQSNRFAFLDAAFPGKFRAWQFNSTPRGYFSSKENVVGAVRWLVEERLLIPLSSMTKVEIWDQKIAHKVTTAVFTRHGLGGLVQQYRSPESLLRLAYPDQFFPWSFRSCAKGKWIGKEGKKLAAQATRWLLDEYLMLDPDDPAVKPKIFLKNGLGGMLKICFKTDVRAAVLNAYPERIEKT